MSHIFSLLFPEGKTFMKTIFTILGVLLSLTIFAQNNAVTLALKDGDAVKFSSYFAPTIDIKLPGENEMKNINRTEAASIIQNFFSDHNITGVDVTSQREMSGTMYITGKLKDGKSDHNITVMMKNKEGSMSVITVRIN